MNELDVVIVGGGAAGVAAARTLAGAGQRVLIVEARDRLGGRGHTVWQDGMALDLGCGWLHSAERNPWVRLAEAAGFTIDRTPSAWGAQWRELGFSKAQQKEAGGAWDAWDRRLRENPPASDRASDALEPGNRWNAWLDALSGYINGASLSQLSVADYLAYDDAASETNWRLPQGYGALIASHARVPVALATPVERIDAGGTLLRLHTRQGEITARQAIVTVPTSVLAAGGLRLDTAFDPQIHAAARLPLGLANKLFLSVDGADALDADSHLLGDPHSAGSGSYYLRPFGRPVVECFFGGTGAVELERDGLDRAADFAIGQLCALLGSSWRQRLRLIAGSAWGRDDYALGSYSHACPGAADQRKVLASTPDPRLRFAGEACSQTDFSTAHGAYASGKAAAEALLES